MKNKRKVLPELFEQHIKDTPAGVLVPAKTVFLCNLTNVVREDVGFSSGKIYVTSRMVKHLYDRKSAEEFHFLINNIHTIVKYPDRIYKNKDSKRGDYCFFKSLKGNPYLCSVEIVSSEDTLEENYVATAFRLRKDSYLKSYELLWSWKDGAPSS